MSARVPTILLLSALSVAALAATQPGVDERTGLKRWDASGDDVRLRLVQRLPDQTRGFFIGRGFNVAQADLIAADCVLQTIVYNDGATPMTLDIGEWSARVDDRVIHPRLMDDWQREWEAQGVAKGPRIAFRWALFPNQQEFAPGDWNMGMTTWPVPPGADMDVSIRWHADGKSRQLTAHGVQCASAAPSK